MVSPEFRNWDKPADQEDWEAYGPNLGDVFEAGGSGLPEAGIEVGAKGHMYFKGQIATIQPTGLFRRRPWRA
jgi:hypothetical protein